MSRLNKFYMSEEQHMERGESILTDQIINMINNIESSKCMIYYNILLEIKDIGAVVSVYDTDWDCKRWSMQIDSLNGNKVTLISEDDIYTTIYLSDILTINETGEIVVSQSF